MANKRKFRITIHTLTSWGASVVIIGVMAKLLRWHTADTLIIVGMLTEALLFFILGFQSDEIKVVKEDGDELVVAAHAVAQSNQNNISPVQLPIAKSFESGSPDLSQYHTEMENLAQNLKNLNAAYQKISEDLNNMGPMAEHTVRVTEESEKLAKNLTALNAVYKNMLNAMHMPNA